MAEQDITIQDLRQLKLSIRQNQNKGRTDSNFRLKPRFKDSNSQFDERKMSTLTQNEKRALKLQDIATFGGTITNWSKIEDMPKEKYLSLTYEQREHYDIIYDV